MVQHVKIAFSDATNQVIKQIRLGGAKLQQRITIKTHQVGHGAKGATNTKIVGNLEPENVLSTSIVRNGNRLVLNQGRLPTCGPNSCAMVLDTAGLKFDLGKLMIDSKVGVDGANMLNLTKALRNQGLVDARLISKASIEQLSVATSKGHPAVVAMNLDRGGHAIVVDGLTIRNGQHVVAIREPALGRQYFTPIDEFNQKFTGNAIFTNPKSK